MKKLERRRDGLKQKQNQYDADRKAKANAEAAATAAKGAQKPLAKKNGKGANGKTADGKDGDANGAAGEAKPKPKNPNKKPKVGATTSRAHTAVKIQPVLDSPVVHVNDASRSVPVVQKLLGSEAAEYVAEVRSDYDRLAEQYANRSSQRNFVPIASARAQRVQPNFALKAPAPAAYGVFPLHDYPLADLVPYIDWTPFFMAWDLHGKYPRILEDQGTTSFFLG